MLCVISLIAIGGGVFFWFKSDQHHTEPGIGLQDSQSSPHETAQTFQPVPREKVIDLNQVHEDENLQKLVQERKEEFGLDKGVDVIVRTDESFKVGETIIPMREILEKIRIKQGDILEEGLTEKSFEKTLENRDWSEEKDHSFGVYVVKPNDNLWNIHFRFLQDYFDNKNIRLSPLADKPDNRGFSSGIGKILKFSEKIVYIYNIREHNLDVDLNLIHPESKIVVFHMAEILSLLDQIDLEKVNLIRFDGENLWISEAP